MSRFGITLGDSMVTWIAIFVLTLSLGSLGSPLISRNSKRLADLAAGSRLPALSPFRAFAESGGLMTYGQSFPETMQRCGEQVGKILRGAKPGDLAIERPTQFDLIINLKTAEALGLTIPPTLLFQANEVVQ